MKNTPISADQLIDDAMAYFSGRGVSASIDDGIKCLKIAASQQSAEANYRLGVIYSNGRIQPFNADQAMFYFLAAAEMGHQGADFGLAQLATLEKDYEAARKLYIKLAEQGHLPSQLNAAQLCLMGRGGSVDLDSAVRFLERASHTSSLAAYQLALMYYRGDEISQNYALAIRFAEKAIDMHHQEAIALLAGILALETPYKDINRSIALYKKAQSLGIEGLDDSLTGLTERIDTF